jgi:hypothetical protein
MSTPEIASPSWILVKTCQDLVQKSQSPDMYAKLRMAGLLRHLLIGGHAVLDRAIASDTAAADAGADAEPPTFWFREPPDDGTWKSAEGFDASRRAIAHGTVRRGPKAEFLEARVAYFGQWYTVAQLLTAIEHFYGGAPSTGLEGVSRPSMMALDAAVKTQTQVVVVALQEIAGVVLRALIPFAEKHQPEGDRPAPRAPVAPSGSACPFAGKIALE